MNRIIIDTKDYTGQRVILTFEKLAVKSVVHPDLLKRAFLKNVKQTIEKPDEVWQDKDNRRCKRCYYKKYSPTSFVKVVIWIKSNPYYVITAFQIDYIKEMKYQGLKRLK